MTYIQIKKLIENDDNVVLNLTHNQIEKTIYRAIELKDISTLKYLLKHISADMIYEFEFSLAEYICMYGSTSILELVNMQFKELCIKDTALLYACSYANESMLNLLINFGYDVNQVDVDGWNGLHYASQDNKISLAKILIENGCDVNKICNEGFTPLYIAASEGNNEIVELLLKNKAIPDLTKSTTPFMISCVYGHYQSAKLLLDYGADINFTDEYGRNSLAYALAYNNKQIIELLEEHNASYFIYDVSKKFQLDLRNEQVIKRISNELK